jgi:hypothetical protein
LSIREDPDVVWFLEAAEDELFLRLGGQLLGDSLGMRPDDTIENQRFGRAWFDAHATEFRAVVCAHPFAKGALSGDPTGILVDIMTVVLPLVDNQKLLALTVSGIIMRQGLTAFCQLGDSSGV